MFIINNSFTLHHPMREHRIQLDTLDARWGRYHALISRSDKLQRKSVLTPSSVIAVIEHSSSIRNTHKAIDKFQPESISLLIPQVRSVWLAICVSVYRFDVHVYRACLSLLSREFNRD